MRPRKSRDPAALVDEAEARAEDEAEYQAALADYYRRYPTFASIYKSLKGNHPGLHERQLMQAARRAEDARPKPVKLEGVAAIAKLIQDQGGSPKHIVGSEGDLVALGLDPDVIDRSEEPEPPECS